MKTILFERLAASEIETYRDLCEHYLGVRFPLSYLRSADIRIIRNSVGQIGGGFLIATQAPFRTLNSLPESTAIPENFESQCAEINGLWLAPEFRSGSASAFFWLNLWLRVILTPRSKFLFAYAKRKAWLDRLYKVFNRKILFEGLTKMVEGMSEPEEEVIGTVTRLNVFFLPFTRTAFLIKRFGPKSKHKRSERQLEEISGYPLFLRGALRICVLLALVYGYSVASETFETAEKRHVQTTVWIQDHVARGEAPKRGVHARSYGCARASFEIYPGIAKELRAGVLARRSSPGPIPGVIRFSAGSPHHQTSDRALDVRGFALKLFVPRENNDGRSETQVQDFLMISSPVAPASTIDGFQEFMRASAKGKLAASSYILSHPETLAMWTNVAARPPKSLLSETYWSVTPFSFGSVAAKFRVVPNESRPCQPLQKTATLFKSTNYLKLDLDQHLAGRFACFDFEVQQRTPVDSVEDAKNSWRGPWQKVARIVIQPQADLSPKDPRQGQCEDWAFTPFNSLAEHLPLGNLNAFRRETYKASAQHRK